MALAEFGVPSMGFLVWHLSLRWQVQLTRALMPLGVTHTDYALLASLHGLSRSGTRPSQRQLADVSGLEPMHVSKLARRLQQARLIERTENPADPRAMQLSLTDRGVEVVTAARRIVRKLEEQRLAVLGGPSSAQSIRLRDSLRELLRQAESDPVVASSSSRRARAKPQRSHY
jgi:DNA-binding MarR family transcriptional regulator